MDRQFLGNLDNIIASLGNDEDTEESAKECRYRRHTASAPTHPRESDPSPQTLHADGTTVSETVAKTAGS